LETGLRPDPEDRFSDAAEALDSLDQRAGNLTRTEEMHHATLEETPECLQISAQSRPTMTSARRGFLICAALVVITSIAGGGGLASVLSLVLVLSFLAAVFSLLAPGGLGLGEIITTELTVEDDSLHLERTGPLGLWNEQLEIDDLAGLTLVETRHASRLSHYGGDLGPLSHNLLPSENETIRRRLEDWSERE
jgi:hypothetical protein